MEHMRTMRSATRLRFTAGAGSSALAARLEPLLLRLVKYRDNSVEKRVLQSLECELGHVSSWETDCRYAFAYEPLSRLMGNSTYGALRKTLSSRQVDNNIRVQYRTYNTKFR